MELISWGLHSSLGSEQKTSWPVSCFLFPGLLCQQCWKFLRACWQWCADGCDNSQQVWDLQCIVGRIQPIGHCNPCVMSVRGPYKVGRTVQTLRNNTQQHPATCNRVCKRTQHVTSNNVESCWPTMLRPFARGLKREVKHFHVVVVQWRQINVTKKRDARAELLFC